MFEKIKAKILFEKLLKRHDINQAYKMVGKEDPWYDTISTVHKSLAEIQKLPHKTFSIKSRDGLTLKGVYYPSAKESVKTVICVHGYTSHAEREWAFPGLFYLSLGFNVLIPYQRAHGISEGDYITFGAMEHSDVMNWVEEINRITPCGQIVIHGLSMGGGITLYCSDKQMENVRCLIADAPNLSIADFFKNVSKEFFPKNHTKISDNAIKKFNRKFSVDISDFEGLEIVKNCRYPLLLLCGGNEPIKDKFKIIETNNPDYTKSVVLPGCDHGNGMYKQTELCQDSIKEFVNRYTDN